LGALWLRQGQRGRGVVGGGHGALDGSCGEVWGGRGGVFGRRDGAIGGRTGGFRDARVRPHCQAADRFRDKGVTPNSSDEENRN